jgi:BNR/Asp-box repeat
MKRSVGTVSRSSRNSGVRGRPGTWSCALLGLAVLSLTLSACGSSSPPKPAGAARSTGSTTRPDATGTTGPCSGSVAGSGLAMVNRRGAQQQPGTAVYTTNSGESWSTGSIGDAGGSSISCSSPKDCAALSGDTLFTEDGGASWSSAPSDGTAPSYYRLACSTAEECMGINVANALTDASSSLAVTSNGGDSWSSPDLVSVTDPQAVACGSPDDCVVLGDSGAAYTTDGGTTWSPSSAPPPVSNPQAASCPAPSVCVVVGGQGNGLGAAFSTDGGNSWSAGSLPGSSSYLTALACPSTSDCVALINSGSAVYTTSGGMSWAISSVPSGTNFGAPGGVACATTSDCVAVGASSGATSGVLYSTDGGASWHGPGSS